MCRPHLQIVDQEGSEVAAAREQHVAMGLEDAAFNEDAAVTEEVPPALLIELQQQFGQVARHFHVCTSATPGREGSSPGWVRFNGTEVH